MEAGAEMCTLDATTIVASFDGKEILMNTSPARSRKLAEMMRARGIKPEWEVFSPTHILQDVTTLIEAGLDEAPYFVNLVLNVHRGFQNAMPYSPRVLQMMVDRCPRAASSASVASVPRSCRAAMNSLLLGGHVRVGLEDNLYYPPGRARHQRAADRAHRPHHPRDGLRAGDPRRGARDHGPAAEERAGQAGLCGSLSGLPSRTDPAGLIQAVPIQRQTGATACSDGAMKLTVLVLCLVAIPPLHVRRPLWSCGTQGTAEGEDQRNGERLIAFIAPQGDVAVTGDELRALCTDRLVGYKHPGEIRFLDELPLTPAKKLDPIRIRALV